MMFGLINKQKDIFTTSNKDGRVKQLGGNFTKAKRGNLKLLVRGGDKAPVLRQPGLCLMR